MVIHLCQHSFDNCEKYLWPYIIILIIVFLYIDICIIIAIFITVLEVS